MVVPAEKQCLSNGRIISFLLILASFAANSSSLAGCDLSAIQYTVL